LDQLINIKLFGQSHTFRADAGVDHVNEVSELLAQEVARIESQQNDQPYKISNLAVMISAALNIATQHIALKNSYVELAKKVTKRTAALTDKLDATIVEIRPPG
jgi:hypothetical protein